MDVFYKNKNFVVNPKGFSNADGQSSSISTLTDEIFNLEKRINQIKTQIPISEQSYREWVKIGNWTEALKHTTGPGGINDMKIELAALEPKLDALKTKLGNLLSAEQAEIAEKLANAKLTPTERAELEERRKRLEIEAQRAQSVSSNKKILIITASAITFLVVVIYIWHRAQKGKKANVA